MDILIEPMGKDRRGGIEGIQRCESMDVFSNAPNVFMIISITRDVFSCLFASSDLASEA